MTVRPPVPALSPDDEQRGLAAPSSPTTSEMSPALDSELRRSLLPVLVVDLVALLAWVAWSRRGTALAGLVCLCLALPVALTVTLRPPLRRAVALLVRRKASRRHIIVPVAASVVLIALALQINERASHLPLQSAIHHLGPIDELIVSSDVVTRNAAFDALALARIEDRRLNIVIDDVLPLVAVDGSLRVNNHRRPVTVVELDMLGAQSFGRRDSETGLVGMAPLLAGEVAVDPSLVGATGRSPSVELSIAGSRSPATLRVLPKAHAFGALDLLGLGDPRLGNVGTRPVVYVAPGSVTTAVAALGDGALGANLRYLLAVSNVGGAGSGSRHSTGATALLASVLASPPAPPPVVSVDQAAVDGAVEALGLGGSVVKALPSIEATVISVKDDHTRRVTGDATLSQGPRQLARGALFGAACVALAVAHRRRRFVRAAQARALHVIGLRDRTAVVVGAAISSVSVALGLILGFVTTGVVGFLVGPISSLDRPLFEAWTTLLRALSVSVVLVALPTLASLLALAAPQWTKTAAIGEDVRRIVGAARQRHLPPAFLIFPGAAVLAMGVTVGSVYDNEWSLMFGSGAAVLGGAVMLNASLFRVAPFGPRDTSVPIQRARRASFAVTAAGCVLVLLPMVAAQSLQGITAASAVGGWTTVASVDDQSNATGVLRELVRTVGGRVFHRVPLVLEGGRNPEAAMSVIASAPLDSAASTAFGAGAVIVSTRFARSYLGGIAVNDRLVLRDPSTGRSVAVRVAQLANLPRWAGDVATSHEVLASVETERRLALARSAVAVSSAPVATVRANLVSMALSAASSVEVVSDEPATFGSSLIAWLRRVALVILGLGVLVGASLRSAAWKPVRLAVLAVAAGFGTLIAVVAGRAPGLSPHGPVLAGALLAVSCAVSADAILTPNRTRRSVGENAHGTERARRR